MSNITVSGVNSALAWLIVVNIFLGGVILASVTRLDAILPTQAVHKTLPTVPGDESFIKISAGGWTWQKIH